MFRADDFNSNTVARFPVKFNAVAKVIDSANGITPSIIYSAGVSDPGAKIKKIFVNNNTENIVKIELRLLETAGPFFSYEVPAGEVVELIKILEYEIELGVEQTLFLSPAAPVALEEEIYITVFANEF